MSFLYENLVTNMHRVPIRIHITKKNFSSEKTAINIAIMPLWFGKGMFVPSLVASSVQNL